MKNNLLMLHREQTKIFLRKRNSSIKIKKKKKVINRFNHSLTQSLIRST